VLRRLNGVTPCFSALVVKGLASPELLMEVDITAVTEVSAGQAGVEILDRSMP
jgi:hypothetical protein